MASGTQGEDAMAYADDLVIIRRDQFELQTDLNKITAALADLYQYPSITKNATR